MTGTVEPGEVTLVSPLQGASCVWYRSRVGSGGDDDRRFAEERGVGFRVRDDSGTIRVFPRGARFDVPPVFEADSGPFGEAPPGLSPRSGGPYAPGHIDTEAEREAAIAELLTVRPAGRDPWDEGDGGRLGLGGAASLGGGGGGRRHYEEARLGPGDTVTVVGAATPFGHLEDPHGADLLDRFDDPLTGLEDPEVAAEIAEARAAGTLLTPEEAWGNAAIPGFGVGRPVRPPRLDAGVHAPTLATADEAAQIERTFDLAPDLLVLAAAPGVPLVIALGTPGAAVARAQGRFLLGLLGAVLAIACAVGLALVLSGAIG